MSKKITFTAKNEYGWEVFPKPFPAKQAIPKWWKDMTPYLSIQGIPDSNKKVVIGTDGIPNHSFKKCTPMLDALTSGYIVPLWTDVLVRQTENGPYISWKTTSPVFIPHGTNALFVENPVGYSNLVFKYMNTWIPKTPLGYSVLVTAPFGYRNLPFQAIPAVIDSDKSTLEIIPPMWLKEGFEGVIEKGTPMFQITPFKRETWNSEFTYYKDGEYSKIEDKNFNATISNHYVKNVWSKKDYN